MKHSFKQNNSLKSHKKLCRTILIGIVSFLVLTFLEVFLLSAVSLIPRSAIRKHTQESAEYLLEKPVFYRVVKQDPASNIDHYADAILLNILYHFDSAHPVTSPLSASYYYTDTRNENENLYTAVTSDVTPTYDYFRYWHGSTIFIRPLLTILNIRQIYIFFAIILAILFVVLFTQLTKSGHTICALAMSVALLSVSFWFIPMSLEYIWCFLIMLIAGILTILLYQKKQEVSGLFFLLVGNITAYFDFLSTETITLLFPLALLLILMQENNRLSDAKTGFKIILSRSVCWGFGYLASWIAKWSITSIALKRNIFAQALSSASTRVNGDAGSLHGPALSINAFLRNIACIFPFNFMKGYGYIAAIGVFALLLMVYYLFRKNEKKNYMPWLFTVLYCIPYIRFLTLANHAFLHYFFTYRAQFASIFCLCMIFYYGVDWKLVSKKFLKPRKRHRTNTRKS